MVVADARVCAVRLHQQIKNILEERELVGVHDERQKNECPYYLVSELTGKMKGSVAPVGLDVHVHVVVSRQ